MFNQRSFLPLYSYAAIRKYAKYSYDPKPLAQNAIA